MNATRRSNGRDGTLSMLNEAIDTLNHAREASSTQVAFGNGNSFLSIRKVFMPDRTDCVELLLACADVCSALDRGMEGLLIDQLSSSTIEAIQRLIMSVAMIQRKAIKISQRGATSHILHGKRDRAAIAACVSGLNRILNTFNTELVMHTHMAPLAQVVAPESDHMVPSPLQHLYDLDKASPQFHQQLSDFLCGEEYGNPSSKLQSCDLASLAEYLDSVLAGISDHAIPAFQQSLRELGRICGTEKVLPKSCILPGTPLVVGQRSASGRVYEGTFDGLKVQVRGIGFHADDGLKKFEASYQGVAVWKRLAHRNITPILGVTTDFLQLISVWVSDEDLTSYIKNRPEADKQSLLSDVAEGLRYLHSCDVIHGNLEGQTILVDITSRARITDIGLATGTQNPVPVHHPSAYHEHRAQWTAPEILHIPGARSKEGDVFSFAGVMIEAFTGATPFSDESSHMAASAIIDGKRPLRPSDRVLIEGLWTLMQRCWDQEAHRRPTALEVSHSFDIPAWKQLISRPLSADECTFHVTALLSDHNETEAVKRLRVDDAQTFVDVVDKALDTLAPSLQEKCLGVLRKICGRRSLLPKSIQIPRCNLRLVSEEYHGGYGRVWKGEFEGLHIAVKVPIVSSKNNVEKIKSTFCKEVMTWKALRHPNVLPLLGVSMDHFQLAMVSEWMMDGNINEFIEGNRDKNRFELLEDIARGLSYFHSREMIHGDLKGANILITPSGRACIADFGLTTISDPSQFTPSSSLTSSGTTRWMSPELLHPDLFGFKGSRPTKAADCYALGMVILEVLSGQVPFAGDTHTVVMRKVMDGERPQRPEGVWFTDVLWATLERCWSP